MGKGGERKRGNGGCRSSTAGKRNGWGFAVEGWLKEFDHCYYYNIYY